MATLMRLMVDKPETSVGYILSYIMKPEAASSFTLHQNEHARRAGFVAEHEVFINL